MEGKASPTEMYKPEGTLKSYVAGFALSIFLTLAAYLLVVGHLLAAWPLALTISALAVAQVVVQLIFFLHLGTSSAWNKVVFFFMVLIVAILVVGTLWIMYNLDYRMME